MLEIGNEQITQIFCGEMGIKQAIIGNESVYNRGGSYIYIYLETKEEE